jgi:hypothetical protein
LIRKLYGAYLFFDGKTFIVPFWLLSSVSNKSFIAKFNFVAVTDQAVFVLAK